MYCWQHGGSITEDRRSYGYIAETENYRFCLRCTPFPGEYQGYLYCYDLCQQEMYRQEHPVVGRVTFASGEQQEFTDSKALLQAIREELPFRSTTGFRFETLTDDPEVKKAVDDILLDFAGEDNSRRTCNYGLTETGKQALRKAADPSIPHTYAWFVMADTNTPQEIIRQDLTLEEAIQIYQDSNTSEKRLGVIKDGIIEMDEIPAIQELLKDAKSFCCYGFDCYERYWDITDEEYLAQLETKREEITHEILERCRTKRKNLYITGPVALNVAQKFSVHRLCDKEGKHNLANRFVGELMEQLVQDGLLVTTKTRNGPGVRTATDAEISSPLPGQQQMTL